jgi:hypothetical protein
MSTDDPYPFNLARYIADAGRRITGDAYWIVKLAFHPEWASRFNKKNRR